MTDHFLFRARAISMVIGVMLVISIFSPYAAAIMVEDSLRTISAEFYDQNGMLIASDAEANLHSIEPPRGLIATIGGSQFNATVATTAFDLFGFDGITFRPGRVYTDLVFVEYLTNVNPTPLAPELSFIVNGGTLQLVGDSSSWLRFHLQIKDISGLKDEQIFDDNFGTLYFQSVIELTGSASFAANLHTEGDDLGSAFNGSNLVTIPFSVNNVTLPEMLPGEEIDLAYVLAIEGGGDVVEILSFDFRDPPVVEGDSAFTVVNAAPVPVPPMLGLFGGLMLTLIKFGKKGTVSVFPALRPENRG